VTAERNVPGVLEAIEEAGQLLVTCPDIELGVQVAKELEAARATVEAMAEALKLARSELNGLPHSLGYEFTHIPKIDAALARYEGTPNAD
jgi:cytosine/adenosine deaminase-related metal-dependent hydrolase